VIPKAIQKTPIIRKRTKFNILPQDLFIRRLITFGTNQIMKIKQINSISKIYDG
jgi:hypothetical protein